MDESDLDVVLLRVEGRVSESRRMATKAHKLADETIDQARRSLSGRLCRKVDKGMPRRLMSCRAGRSQPKVGEARLL